MQAITAFRDEHRFLSNFEPVPIEALGLTFASVEHAYVASKSHDPAWHRQIQALRTASEAKRVGRTLIPMRFRPDWLQARVAVMDDLLRQKFGREPFMSKLLATGTVKLVEGNWWGDTFWGVCNGIGENNLGFLLMMIRQDLLEITR